MLLKLLVTILACCFSLLYGQYEYDRTTAVVSSYMWKYNNGLTNDEIKEISKLDVSMINVSLNGGSNEYLEDLAKVLRLAAPNATITIISSTYLPRPCNASHFEVSYPALLDENSKAIYSPLYRFDPEPKMTERFNIIAVKNFNYREKVIELLAMPKLELIKINLFTGDDDYLLALKNHAELDFKGKIIILKNVAYDNSDDHYSNNIWYDWTF